MKEDTLESRLLRAEGLVGQADRRWSRVKDSGPTAVDKQKPSAAGHGRRLSAGPLLWAFPDQPNYLEERAGNNSCDQHDYAGDR